MKPHWYHRTPPRLRQLVRWWATVGDGFLTDPVALIIIISTVGSTLWLIIAVAAELGAP